MFIDYEKLASIAVDPISRSALAKDTSDVLYSYLQLFSNLIHAASSFTESEMAMIVCSMNMWLTKKHVLATNSYSIGKIVQLEWGNNFSPELSYRHPAVIIETWKNMVLVIPATSNSKMISTAYHPVDNPKGKWYYRKVGSEDGFAHDCVLIINNAKIVAKSRIISVIGSIPGDLSDQNNVFREIRRTMIQHFFSKEWTDYKNLERDLTMAQKEISLLQTAYEELLAENQALKSNKT